MHGKIYVSAGKTDSRIAVLSATGQLEKTLTDLPGASALAFDPTYSTLYVSLSSREIARIDTATQSVTGRFSVSPYVPNGQMAYAGGRLWFGQSCGDTFASIVHVNPDGSGLGVSGPTRYCATFASTPSHPELLAVSELGLSPVDAFLYRVDNGGFTQVASTSNRPFSNLQNLAFNGGGTILYGASGSPYEIQSFSVPGLAKSISYPVDAYPAAVATQGDAYLAAGRFGGANTIAVFAAGNPSPVRTIELPQGREMARGALSSSDRRPASSPSPFRLPAPPARLSVHVFGHVTTPPLPATIKLTASAKTVTYGGRVTLTASVTSGATGTVHFYNGVTVDRRAVARQGRASLTVRIQQTSNFSATYDGDDVYEPAKSAAVTVSPKYKITLAFVAAGKHSFRVGSQPRFLVTVRPARQVTLTCDPAAPARPPYLEQRKPFTTSTNGVFVGYIKKGTRAGHFRLRAIVGSGSSAAATPWYHFDLVR